MTSYQARLLWQKIQRHTHAQVDLSWKGSREPVEHKEIETEARNARRDLSRFIDNLTVS